MTDVRSDDGINDVLPLPYLAVVAADVVVRDAVDAVGVGKAAFQRRAVLGVRRGNFGAERSEL